MQPDPAEIAQVAAQYSIPPAILMAVGQQESGFSDDVISGTRRGSSGEIGAYQFMPATAAGYGYSVQQLAGNFTLQLQLAARKLHDLYSQYRSWGSALSAYNSGSPTGAPSYAQSVLAIAGRQPTYGLSAPTTGMGGGAPAAAPTPSFRPSDLDFWRGTATDFAASVGQAASLGGAVSPTASTAFTQAAGLGSSGSGSTAGMLGSGRAATPVPFTFQASPFDPSYLGAETEAFGDTSGPGGYAESGNDYGLPHGTPLTAPVSGKVHVVDMGHAGTGLTAYIQMDNGWTVGLGHLASVNVKEGDVVQAGQLVAASGGVPGVDTSPGNSTGAHIEFQLLDPSGRFVDPRGTLVGASGLPTTGAPSAATTGTGGTDPEADAVAAFAQEAASHGIDPTHLSANIGQAISMMRMLVGRDTMSLSDYAPLSGMDPSAMLDWFRRQPHGTYPGITAGQFHDTAVSASLYSLQHQKRQPEIAEVARFATIGATPQMMQSYYQQTAGGSGSPASIPTPETFSTTHGSGIRSS